MTVSLIGVISAVNAAAAVRLVAGIIGAEKFSNDPNVLLAQRRCDLAQQRHRLRPVVPGP